MSKIEDLVFERDFVMTRNGIFGLNPTDARFKEGEFVKVTMKVNDKLLTEEEKKQLRSSYVRFYRIPANRMFRASSKWNIPDGTPITIRVQVITDEKEKKEAEDSIGRRYGDRGRKKETPRIISMAVKLRWQCKCGKRHLTRINPDDIQAIQCECGFKKGFRLDFYAV